LTAARKLLASQGSLIEKQNELLGLENQLSAGLRNLRTLDAEQKIELQKAVDAANRQIAALEAEIVVLKKKRFTFLKAVKYILIGVAAGVVGGVVLVNK
jgi:uncharacterized protein involved in exopolysaccharide biosynthesis